MYHKLDTYQQKKHYIYEFLHDENSFDVIYSKNNDISIEINGFKFFLVIIKRIS